MCGIVGFTGRREASPVLLEGLRRLEYRGYDSAGLVTGTGADFHLRKKAGRLAELTKEVAARPAPGCFGISHTRWATHGGATDRNAHPHTSAGHDFAVVHNGVIENYAALKHQLQDDGVAFRSDTDTEVLAHLIAHCYQGDLLQAVSAALALVKGTYGLAVMCRAEPGVIVGARLGSPLVIGIGDDGHYLASDASALAGFADKVVYLNDRQVCQLDETGYEIRNQDLDAVDVPVHEIAHLLGAGDADRGDFPHYMLKEIYEQPEALENAMRGRLDPADATAHFGGLNLSAQQLRQIDRVIFTACGTSYHAGLVGEYLFEELARVPAEVEYASEFRYRNPPIDRSTLIFAITQSGETADTLAALRESKRMGHTTLAICNVVGSSIAREADGGVYLHAGPEIGVASTKAFTSQCAVLAMLALYLGRQFLYPGALEGALKLKEISYIHAEGYPAAEMKHGPIALVDEQTPSVFLVPRGSVFDKVMSNMQEIKARGGPVIAVASPGDREVAAVADDVIPVPDVPEYLQPIVTAIPLQLLAYEIALLCGCDVDKPRNLAKSVTVE
ncbi:MAG TPA: glutamine--fructose-6-phosphate transaminase (isomerizing) [Urbifossiella sp.]|nr:glutamine--fructose-6-phosphate transaminase (isomerizing) [Urbifossiella sp.]